MVEYSSLTFAATVLVADALVHLLPHALEGADHETMTTVGIAATAGCLAIMSIPELVEWHHGHRHEKKSAEDAEGQEPHVHAYGIANLVTEMLHNFVDGIGLGMAWRAGASSGCATALAEIGDFMVLRAAGFPVGQLLGWNFLASLTCLGGVGLVHVLGQTDWAAVVQRYTTAFTAGSFLALALNMVFPQVSQTIHQHHPSAVARLCLAISVAAIWTLVWIGEFEADFEGQCVTLEPENREDVALLALTQDGRLLLSIDVSGHALLINFEALDAVRLGAKGDWLAVGSGAVGQLLVWEWRSETYVLKQQGHHWGVKCCAFSPGAVTLKRGKALASNEARPEERSSALGGRLLATGGYDGKVKLFNAQSGLCFVTFAEHTAPVQQVCFTPQGNAVLSASADGSVRAFDLLRYRNFRTFASPDGLCQFSSLAVDSGGEIVAASAKGGKYAIYAFLNSKFMTEAGISWKQYDLSDSEADDLQVFKEQERRRKALALPGVSVGEAKEPCSQDGTSGRQVWLRKWGPEPWDAYSDKELHLWSVAFSADSQQFAVATTHGVFVYSQDAGGIAGISGGIYGGDSRFVPQILTKAVSAPAVLKALEDGEISKAMILALALNDYALLRKVYEQVPVSSIELVVASIGAPLLPALLRMSSGRALRTGSLESSSSDVAALCLQLLVELSQRHAGMSKIFEKNTYSLRFLGSVPSETGDEEVGNEGKEIKEETKPAPDLEEEAEAEAPLHRTVPGNGH
eukprot:g2515.t2